MTDQGLPIWYELMTPDPDGAKRFYDAVVGWTIEAQPSGPIDYRMITVGDGNVGGVMRLGEEMLAGGARPGWLGYTAVADVDATAAQATSLGGRAIVPPTDIPDVGRFALLADPDGAPFYVMRPTGEGESTAFHPTAPGHCSWNELGARDTAAVLGFYGALFGWTEGGRMAMPGGDYIFLHHGDTPIGAMWTATGEQPGGWRYYFRVPAIDAAIDAVGAAGGKVTIGPHEVPGGDHIVVGTDPQGAEFALVGAGSAA